jgi:uncharacterized protein (TIGR02246 family)
MDGWNTGSGKAIAPPFEENDDLVRFDGTHLNGRQEIATFHQQLFDLFVKGSRLVGKVRTVRLPTQVKTWLLFTLLVEPSWLNRLISI